MPLKGRLDTHVVYLAEIIKLDTHVVHLTEEGRQERSSSKYYQVRHLRGVISSRVSLNNMPLGGYVQKGVIETDTPRRTVRHP